MLRDTGYISGMIFQSKRLQSGQNYGNEYTIHAKTVNMLSCNMTKMFQGNSANNGKVP